MLRHITACPKHKNKSRSYTVFKISRRIRLGWWIPSLVWRNTYLRILMYWCLPPLLILAGRLVLIAAYHVSLIDTPLLIGGAVFLSIALITWTVRLLWASLKTNLKYSLGTLSSSNNPLDPMYSQVT